MKRVIQLMKNDLKRIFSYPGIYKVSDDTYSEYWERRKDFTHVPELSDWQKDRFAFVSKTIQKNASVVDIGCGDGAFLNALQGRISEGTGIDIHDESLHSLKKLGFNALKLDVNGGKNFSKEIPDSDYFFCFEIIEHVKDSEWLLLELKRKAKKGVYVSFPNSGYYAYRLRLLFGKFPAQWVVAPNEHIRFWTMKDAKYMCESLAMTNCILKGYRGIPILNRIFPALFCEGILIFIPSE